MTEQELAELCDKLDDAIQRLSLEDAIEAMEYVQQHVHISLGGLYHDRKKNL